MAETMLKNRPFRSSDTRPFGNDANNYFYTGCYRNTGEMSNIPIQNSFLLVFNAANNGKSAVQFCIDSSGLQIYVRSSWGKNSEEWNEWTRIVGGG